jgi:signal transduction histidine kinase
LTTPPSRERVDTLKAVAAVRHDVNNILMGLVGQVELLQGRAGLPADVSERLDSITQQIERIRDRISELAQFDPENIQGGGDDP